MLGLYRDKYADFTVKHFHEQLVKRHGYSFFSKYRMKKPPLLPPSVKPARGRSAHRKKRQRRPLPGMMLHQDGSRHVWIEGRPPMDLIVTLEDATSEIYSMILVEEEGTASTLRALREVIAAHGLFCSLYTDRGAHYFHTPKGGERASRTHKTQVGRALAQLGIEHIPYSPQARGRSERAFRTLQDRLPKELRLAGIDDVEAANRWLREHYIGEYNKTFAVAPEQEGTAFVHDRTEAWREILRHRGAHGRQRQHHRLGKAPPAAAGKPPAPALRQGPRPGPRISRRQRERVPRPAPVGELRRPRRAAPEPDRVKPGGVLDRVKGWPA